MLVCYFLNPLETLHLVGKTSYIQHSEHNNKTCTLVQQEHISKNISPAGKAKKEGIMKFP
jgi:hypothetical protein